MLRTIDIILFSTSRAGCGYVAFSTLRLSQKVTIAESTRENEEVVRNNKQGKDDPKLLIGGVLCILRVLHHLAGAEWDGVGRAGPG